MKPGYKLFDCSFDASPCVVPAKVGHCPQLLSVFGKLVQKMDTVLEICLSSSSHVSIHGGPEVDCVRVCIQYVTVMFVCFEGVYVFEHRLLRRKGSGVGVYEEAACRQRVLARESVQRPCAASGAPAVCNAPVLSCCWC